MKKKVLFFDSGVGGLSIAKAVTSECLNSIKSYYIFDNEFFPYGTKSESFLKKRVLDLVSYGVNNFKVDCVVVACNTASTIALDTLREHLSVPIVGVVPAIKPACLTSVNKKVCLLATPGTIRREYIKDMIKRYNNDCTIKLIGSSELVYIAEKVMAGDKADMHGIYKVIKPAIVDNCDTIILGCTHFPLIKNYIQYIVGDKVKLIDSGIAVGKRVREILQISEQEMSKENNESFYTGILDREDEHKKIFTKYGFASLNQISI